MNQTISSRPVEHSILVAQALWRSRQRMIAAVLITLLVSLGATASGFAQSPRIFVSPTPHLNFCSVNVGSSADRTVTIYNAGAAPLNVTGLNIPTISGVPTVFSVVSAGAPFTIAPGNRQSVTVRLRPAYPVTQGIVSGRLEIASNDSSASRVNIELIGMGAGGSGGGGTQALTSGVPRSGSVGAPPAGQGNLASTQYTIQAPCAAAELRITLTGNQDVDLFAAINEKITISAGRASSNFSSTSRGGDESLVFSNGTVLPGTYYIAVGNFGPGAANYTVTATLTLNRTPVITSFSPASAMSGGAAFVLSINGANFVPGSTVRWNERELPSSWASQNLLRAIISAAEIATSGAASVTVVNPAPGGGVSNPLNFTAASTAVSVSAASFTGNGAGEGLAVESIAVAFGNELATASETATSLPLPTVLAGTRVVIKDAAGAEREAPLFFVSPTQVNYQIPPGVAAGNATITITSGDGKVAIGNARIATVAPGLFTANANGQGVAAAVALRVKADGSQSFEPVAVFDSAQNKFVAVPIDLGPATDRVFLLCYGTGIRYRSALSGVIATLGGTNAEVSFAGPQGDFVGLDQVNLLIPRSLIGRGEVNVALTVEGRAVNLVRVNIR